MQDPPIHCDMLMVIQRVEDERGERRMQVERRYKKNSRGGGSRQSTSQGDASNDWNDGMMEGDMKQ